MPESATQPQSDTPSDTTQPVISEPRREQEPPPARWRVNRSTLLLIGGPLAGALLVWLVISVFGSNSATPPAVVTDQSPAEPAVQDQPATETPPAVEESVANSAEAVPVQEPEPAPAPAEPEPPQQPDAPLSATNEVTPNVPQSALDTIRGTVRVSVRVTINNAGAVVDATPNDGGPSRYFERLAVNASKKWTFTPANSEEQRTMLVKFNFTREGVTAEAEPDEEGDLTPQP